MMHESAASSSWPPPLKSGWRFLPAPGAVGPPNLGRASMSPSLAAHHIMVAIATALCWNWRSKTWGSLVRVVGETSSLRRRGILRRTAAL